MEASSSAELLPRFSGIWQTVGVQYVGYRIILPDEQNMRVIGFILEGPSAPFFVRQLLCFIAYCYRFIVYILGYYLY